MRRKSNPTIVINIVIVVILILAMGHVIWQSINLIEKSPTVKNSATAAFSAVSEYEKKHGRDFPSEPNSVAVFKFKADESRLLVVRIDELYDDRNLPKQWLVCDGVVRRVVED
ncbi:MAG: hypothetical protein QY304_00415 [Candidatus Paceibacterota bacterium]|nr:MAG: hypothetical protein QY304_00415 [Candidatus Paceibacterota bacterium]